MLVVGRGKGEFAGCAVMLGLVKMTVGGTAMFIVPVRPGMKHRFGLHPAKRKQEEESQETTGNGFHARQM